MCISEICFTLKFMAWKTQREKYLQQQKKQKSLTKIHTINYFQSYLRFQQFLYDFQSRMNILHGG